MSLERAFPDRPYCAGAYLTMELLETMLAKDGRIDLLERHLDRLTRGALALGYPLDMSRVRAALDGAVGSTTGAARVRLTLDQHGGVCVGVVDMARVPAIATVFPVAWSPPEDPVGVCLKTTDRLHYDAALARAWAAGADEAVLVDAAGRVVEATRANVWVRRRGELLTPPLGRRGLEGVMRAHLLATRPDTREVDLTLDDLLQADDVLLSNAVRGLFTVRLGTRPAGSA